jgi:beta-hydroxylase
MKIHTIKFNNDSLEEIDNKKFKNIKIWLESDIINLIKDKYKNFEKYYNKLWINKSRENLSKYLILYEHGGLYINYYLLKNPNIDKDFIKTVKNNKINNVILWKKYDQNEIFFKVYKIKKYLLNDNLIYIKYKNSIFIDYIIKNINVNNIPYNEYQNKIYLGNIFLSNIVENNYYNENNKLIKINNYLEFDDNINYYNTNVYDLADPDKIILDYCTLYKFIKVFNKIFITTAILFSCYNDINYKAIFLFIIINIIIEVIISNNIIDRINTKINVKLNEGIDDNMLFYDPSKYEFTEEIKKNWKKIAKEAKYVFNNAPKLNIMRTYDQWHYSIDYLNNIKNKYGWIKAQSQEEIKDISVENEPWLNYGLITNDVYFEENLLKCPNTFEILSKFKDKINLAGFSYFRANTILEEHNDHSGLSTNSLAFHMGLIIPKIKNSCKLVLYNDKTNQYYYKKEKEGEIIIADTNYKHYAYNLSNEDRVILYIDFKL